MIFLRSARWPRVFRDERHFAQRPPAAVWLLGLSLLIPPGCASHKQVQYFAARDPETGATNYYQLTVKGGAFLAEYRYQAGYFSAAAVDVLRGSMPKVPILDLPVEQMELFDRLTQQFYAALVQDAKCVYQITDPEAQVIAALSMRNVAALRTATISADVNKAQAELDDALKRRTTAEANLESARAQEAQATEAERTASDTLNALLSDIAEAKGVQAGAGDAHAGALEAKAAAEKAVADARAAFQAADALAKAEDLAPEEAERLKAECDRLNAVLTEAERALADATGAFHRTQTALEDARSVLETLEEAPALTGAKANLEALQLRIKGAKAGALRAAGEASKAHLRWLDTQHRADRLIAERDRVQGALDYANKRLTAVETAAGDENVLAGAPVCDGPAFMDEDDQTIKKLTRLIWLGSLSQSDLASIGMTQNTDAYEFRKLVFWSSATNMDLSEQAAEIDGVLDNVVTIAGHAKTQAQARKAQQTSRLQSFEQILHRLPIDPSQAALLNELFKSGMGGGAGGLPSGLGGAPNPSGGGQ